MNNKHYVYFLSCSDIKYNVYKCGACKNWIDRRGTYITSLPYTAPTLLYLIPCSNSEESFLIEALIHYKLAQENTRKNPLYNGGGSEWFNKLPSINELREYLTEYNYDNEIIHGEKLNNYVANLRGTIRPTQTNKYLKMLRIRKFNKRPYQIKAINNAQKLYADTNKLILNWTCGLGKTYTSLCISKKYTENYLLIGVPLILLIEQWLKTLKIIFDNLPILVISSANFNIELVSCSTDTNYIQAWLNQNSTGIIITTYNSSYKIPDTITFDFKILDECHHLCQTRYNTQFCKILDIPSKKQLALTATMKSIDGDHKDNFDEDVFGHVLDSKSVCWAIEEKYITDYEILTIQAYKFIDNNNKVNKDLYLSAFSVLQCIKNLDNFTHILIYANKIENANIISNYVDELLKSKFSELSGQVYNQSLNSENTNNKTINSKITKFKNSRYGIICSVYMFGEGFDLPKLNGVCVAESMGSEIRIVQSILRANRLEKNNPDKISRIILPYTDDETTFDKIQYVVYKMGNYDKNIEQRIKVCKISDSSCENGSEIFNIVQGDAGELYTLKLRLLKRNALPYVESRIKLEYDLHRRNNQMLNIQSKKEYESNEQLLQNPRKYFDERDPSIWKNWYCYLGVDTSIYPVNKTQWVKKCKNHLLTSKNYKNLYSNYDLPEEPRELYKDFGSIENELNIRVADDIMCYL